MKNKTIRPNTWECNSSSSHSLTISLGERSIPNLTHLTLEQGEFGWEWDTYTSFYGKLTYCYTLAKNSYEEKGKFLTMLKEVLFENIPTLETLEEDEKSDGYVDHQSFELIYEVFESKDSLASFLFCQGSEIRTGNDNDG